MEEPCPNKRAVGNTATRIPANTRFLSWLWRLFERPSVYRLNQLFTGYLLSLAYKRLLMRHLNLGSAGVILDIGCGTGDYAPCFLNYSYIGIDVNPEYIKRAVSTYGRMPDTHFICLDINAMADSSLAADFAYCAAVTHHLSDAEVIDMVRNVLKLAKRRFVIVDLYLPSFWRNPLGHILVKLDRGRHGRKCADLVSLLRRTHSSITAISTDFGFPYPAVGITLEHPAQ